MERNQSVFLRCCYGYGVSGMAVLVVGAILPSIMAESGLTFTTAGGLLSMMAIGNLTASMIFPMCTAWFGKRISITVAAAMVPVSLLLLSLLPPAPVMYAALFAAGIGRGAITIINNATVNIISNNSTKSLNLLHCSFAVGAFGAPFLTALLYSLGFTWQVIVYIIVFLCCTSALSYMTMDYPEPPPAGQSKEHLPQAEKTERAFLKNGMFYCLAFMLFFYLGVENCINGWFVTYLQNTGVMSNQHAANMVSFTWLAIMGGRLFCAALSKKYSKNLLLFINALGSCVFFLLLISSANLVMVTAALLGLGFFLAGIYPTTVAQAGQYIKGSTFGMSLLTAISALGGIITPQIIGSVADRTGIVAAISLLLLNAVVLFALALVNFIKNKNSTIPLPTPGSWREQK